MLSTHESHQKENPHAIIGLTMKEDVFYIVDVPCHFHAWIRKSDYEQNMQKAIKEMLRRLSFFHHCIEVFDEAGKHSLPLYRIAKHRPYRKGLRFATAKDKKTMPVPCPWASSRRLTKKTIFCQIRRKLYIPMHYFTASIRDTGTLLLDGTEPLRTW